MERRDFLAASCLMGAAPLTALAGADDGDAAERQYFELRKYHLLPGPKKGLLNDFIKNAAIPALNRLGVGPVGVFSPVFGADNSTLYVLLPHKSLESVTTLAARLLDGDELRTDGAAVVDAPLGDPAYVRVESSLMVAFSQMPKIETPPQTAQGKARIFDLRIYESHSMKAGKKKVEMFNEGGEIAIFRNTGLRPVFFGETVIGPLMPNLTYMLVFDDLPAREAAWANFRSDPAWKELRAKREYANTVSTITDIVLRPLPFSQL